MLYRPETFEPLTEEPWDETRVRAAIRSIVADAEAAFDPDSLWPADEWDAWQARLPLTSLYVGAAGVVWALDALGRRGRAEATLDLPAAVCRALELWREAPDLPAGLDWVPEHGEAGLLSGESGVLLVACRLAPSAALADDLLARVRENVASETNELMWGTPGTMIAARAMLDSTGEERWADAWQDSADALWQQRGVDGLWANPPDGRSLAPRMEWARTSTRYSRAASCSRASATRSSSVRRPRRSTAQPSSRTGSRTGR